ncbi:lipopolysaccharide biosynthesis protein (plasmid) [Enterococcus faecium]|uniref:lipopolysaccharide biosynthesis protein n=1 Tax=Enterococcus faecium TaxID=1352 RepID=UPI0038D3A3BD
MQKKSGICLSYLNIFLKNLSTFLYTPFLIRMLGQIDYGLYQMTTSFMTTLFVLHLGFSTAYIKFYAEDFRNQKKLKQLNGMYLLIFLFLTLLSFGVGVFILLHIDNVFGQSFTSNELLTVKQLIKLLIINIVLTFPSVYFDCYILANEQFKIQKLQDVLITLLVPILTLPFLLLKFKVVTIVCIQVFVTFIFLLAKCKVACIDLDMRFSFKDLKIKKFKSLFLFSAFIFINQFVDVINWNLPNFVLGITSGAKEVSIYGVANQIKNIFLTISTAISSVYIPQVYKVGTEHNKIEKLSQLMCQIGEIQFLIVGYLFGGFIILGTYFIQLWVGSSYDQAYFISILLIIPLIIPAIQSIGMEIIRLFNKHKVVSLVALSFSFLNILITFFFTSKIGIVGSVLGTFVTMLIVNGVFMNVYYCKVIKLNMNLFWQKMVKIAFLVFGTTIICGFFTQLCPINSITVFILFGIGYTIIYLVFASLFIFNSYDRKRIWTFLSKKIRRRENL